MATVIGKPCVKCGSTERYKSGDCAPCTRVRMVSWRKNNPERFTEQQAKRDKEKQKATNKLWANRNKEKMLVYRDEYKARNVNKVKNYPKLRANRITNGYCCSVMRITLKDAPQELLEAKRQQLMMHRAVKQLIETIKEKQDAN